MRRYEKAIENRYNKLDFSAKGNLSNQYALINPVGYYGAIHNISVLKDFVRMLSSRFDPDCINILDAGCGDGFNTRILAELLGSGERIFGFDFSQNEIDHCIAMNPVINYKRMDICDFSYDVKMDGVICFDCFMYLREEHEIASAMNNIYESLNENGLFLWYDCNEDTHFAIDNNEARGYSENEMDGLAFKSGFQLESWSRVYRTVPFYNVSTYYFAKRFSVLSLLLLDKLIPTRQTINVRIYKKH